MTESSIGVCVYDPDGRLGPVVDAIDTDDIDTRTVSGWSAMEDVAPEADCLVIPDHPSTTEHEAVDALDIYDRVRTELFVDTPVLAYTTRDGHRPLRRALDHGLTGVIRTPPRRGTLLRDRIRAAVDGGSSFADPSDQLFSLLRSYPDTLFIKDRAGRFANITTRTAEKYGFDREELVGMTDYELFDEGHADDLWTEEQEIMDTEEPLQGKIEHYVDEAGNDQWVSTTKVPRYDENGNVTGIIGGTEYVTVAKRQEKLITELHEANQRLARAQTKQDIAEESIEIASGIDPFAHTEVALAEFGADSLRPVAATDDTTDLWSEYDNLFEAVLESGTIRYFETGEGRNPRRRIAIVNRKAMVEDDREASGAIIPLGDHGVFAFRLSDREPFDDFVDRLSRVFAANVEAAFDRAERERELDQKRRRIEEFATLGSHELRNKLQVVMANLSRMQAEYDDDELEAALKILDRMDRILQQVLRLARTGEAVSHARDSVEIETAATSAWESIDTESAALRVESTTAVEANPDALVGLFEYLLENAVQHGGRNVTVRVGVRGDGNGFFIADDGPGIDPSDRTDLFDIGYTDERDDRGYGLHVTSAIVEAHDWKISVSESDDGGARFDITGVGDHVEY